MKAICCFGMVAALLVFACSSESSVDPGSVPGGAGDAGNTGHQAGSAGSGGTNSAGAGGQGAAGYVGSKEDFEKLEQCSVSSCNVSTAGTVEGSNRGIAKEAARCVLSALRDRKPGLYRHQPGALFSSGHIRDDYIMKVQEDGSVLYMLHHSSVDSIGSNDRNDYRSAMRCQLADSNYFEGCIAALDAATTAPNDEAWECVFGTQNALPAALTWFERCEAAEVTCN